MFVNKWLVLIVIDSDVCGFIGILVNKYVVVL